MVVIDTPVWSEFFRRAQPSQVREALRALVVNGDAILLGPIRQEVLSGVKDAQQFKRLRDALRAFPNQAILAEDYEQAAVLFNRCRGQGVQGSNTDLLICAVALRLSASIFTLDRDFETFAGVVRISLHQSAG